mmetsp:Transcript_5806/g.19502  ORF Transcript_5806/g.19502 Transcript_5806/m.19502 type:complete len:188 (+) Transcript_5806:719-1282(+)
MTEHFDAWVRGLPTLGGSGPGVERTLLRRRAGRGDGEGTDDECVLALPPERDFLDSAWNCGTVLANRHVSEECLAQWGENILSGQYSRDQPAFAASPACSAVCSLGGDAVEFAKDVRHMVWTAAGLPTGPPKALVHYTSSTHSLTDPCDTGAKGGGPWSSGCWISRLFPASSISDEIQDRACAATDK